MGGGLGDEKCRLNLLTPERVLQGIAEVKAGKTFCLSLPHRVRGNVVGVEVAAGSGKTVRPRSGPPCQWMTGGGAVARISGNFCGRGDTRAGLPGRFPYDAAARALLVQTNILPCRNVMADRTADWFRANAHRRFLFTGPPAPLARRPRLSRQFEAETRQLHECAKNCAVHGGNAPGPWVRRFHSGRDGSYA